MIMKEIKKQYIVEITNQNNGLKFDSIQNVKKYNVSFPKNHLNERPFISQHIEKVLEFED